MKHRFLFILPRLAVLAVIVGIASFVLFLVFKLLLLLLAVGAISVIAGKIISKARAKWLENAGIPLDQASYHDRLRGPAILQPAVNNKSQVNTAIIPIN